MKARKKPIIVDVIKWTGLNCKEITEFIGDSAVIETVFYGTDIENELYIKTTVEDVEFVPRGDYIIRDENAYDNRVWRCPAITFESRYEVIEE